MLRTMRYIQEHAWEFTTPLLLLHGTKDKIIPTLASSGLYRNAGSPDKTYIKYDGIYHEASVCSAF